VEIKLTPPREIYIGRSEDSDVFLGEKKISRKHAQILVNEDEVRIVDLESTNGSFVNSKKISEVKLKNGDKIKVGSSVIEVEILSSSAAEADAPTGAKGKEKAKEKSNPKAAPKKAPEKVVEKVAAKPVEKAENSKAKKDDGSGTVYVKDLEDLNDDSKEKSKPKNYEEDSDLVVEYQTSIKEAKKLKDNDTSEKVSAQPSKRAPEPESAPEFDLESEDDDSVSENNSEGEFEELNLDVEDESSEPEEKESLDLGSLDEEASFDKIPDLENLEENPDMDISLDEQEEAPKSSKPMTGDLSSMGLSDLLQNLNQNKKSGLLSLNNNSSSGKIYMREGSLLGATSDKASGLKAMYRMLTWKSGDFEFQPLAPNADELSVDQEAISESIESILMEGFRQYDELRKIQKVLPQMEDELALESQLEVPISKLHPKVLDVVQLIINHKKMKSVLDLSSLSDLETSKIVFYLIKKKVIRINK
jgi:predicted component of type VI protein secretion system